MAPDATPDGIAGRSIPKFARILSVVDVYDALTTARSYRPALSSCEALRVLATEGGSVLDPELVRKFIETL